MMHITWSFNPISKMLNESNTNILHSFNHRLVFAGLALVLIGATGGRASAQITIDAGALGYQPTLGSNAGVPTVDIVTPQTGGVSHNKYDTLNVGAEGVIYNNACLGSVTLLAGTIGGNGNLCASGPAGVILNEVTGGSASMLAGDTEVAGTQADVIYANANGVTCDGCGFINTGTATLTTAVPTVGAGGDVSLTTSTGMVSVMRGGLDGSGAAGGVNLVGKQVSIDGRVETPGELLIVGGSSAVDLAAKTVSGGGAQTGFAIDASYYGAYEADKITIIGTDAGLGVRQLGGIKVMNGNAALSSAGDLTVRSVSANVDVQSFAANQTADVILNASGTVNMIGDVFAQNVITVNGADIVIGRTVEMESMSGISLTALNSITSQAQIESFGNVDLSAADIVVSAGVIQSHETLSLQGTNDVSVSDASLVADTIDIDAGNRISLDDAFVIASTAATLDADSVRMVDDVAFNIASGAGQPQLTARTLDVAGVLDWDTLTINGLQVLNVEQAGTVIGDALSLNVPIAINNAGLIYSSGNLRIATGTFTNEATGQVTVDEGNPSGLPDIAFNLIAGFVNQGMIIAPGDLAIVGASVSGDGALYVDKALTITSGDIALGGNGIFLGQTVSLTSSGSMTLAGTVQADNSLTLSSAVQTLVSGIVGAVDVLVNNGTLNVTNTGAVIGDNSVTANTSGSIINDGEIYAATLVDIDAAGYAGGGILTSDRTVDINTTGNVVVGAGGEIIAATLNYLSGGDTTVEGTILATGGTATQITVNGALTTQADGQILATNAPLLLDVLGAFNNAGLVVASGSIDTQAGSLINNGTFYSGDVFIRTAGTIQNAGMILADDELYMRAGLQATAIGADLTGQGASLATLTNNGLIQGNSVDLTGSTIINMGANAQLFATQGLNLTVGRADLFDFRSLEGWDGSQIDAGYVASGADLRLVGLSGDFNVNSDWTTIHDVYLKTAGNLNINNATLLTQDNLEIEALGAVVLNGAGKLASYSDLTINASLTDVNLGTLYVAGDADITGSVEVDGDVTFASSSASGLTCWNWFKIFGVKISCMHGQNWRSTTQSVRLGNQGQMVVGGNTLIDGDLNNRFGDVALGGDLDILNGRLNNYGQTARSEYLIDFFNCGVTCFLRSVSWALSSSSEQSVGGTVAVGGGGNATLGVNEAGGTLDFGNGVTPGNVIGLGFDDDGAGVTIAAPTAEDPTGSSASAPNVTGVDGSDPGPAAGADGGLADLADSLVDSTQTPPEIPPLWDDVVGTIEDLTGGIDDGFLLPGEALPTLPLVDLADFVNDSASAGDDFEDDNNILPTIADIADDFVGQVDTNDGGNVLIASLPLFGGVVPTLVGLPGFPGQPIDDFPPLTLFGGEPTGGESGRDVIISGGGRPTGPILEPVNPTNGFPRDLPWVLDDAIIDIRKTPGYPGGFAPDLVSPGGKPDKLVNTIALVGGDLLVETLVDTGFDPRLSDQAFTPGRGGPQLDPVGPQGDPLISLPHGWDQVYEHVGPGFGDADPGQTLPTDGMTWRIELLPYPMPVPLPVSGDIIDPIASTQPASPINDQQDKLDKILGEHDFSGLGTGNGGSRRPVITRPQIVIPKPGDVVNDTPSDDLFVLNVDDDSLNEGTILAQDLDIVGTTLTNNGGSIIADGDLYIDLSEDLISTARLDGTEYTEAGIQAGGSLTADVRGDISLVGTHVGANEDVVLAAGGDVEILAIADVREVYHITNCGLLCGEQRREDIMTAGASVGSTGGSVTVVAGYRDPDGENDVTIGGATIYATQDVNIQATADVILETVSASADQIDSDSVDCGLICVGVETTKYNEIVQMNPTIMGNNINIEAGNDVTGVGAQLNALNELNVTAEGDISFEAFIADYYYETEGWSLGVTFPGSQFIDQVLDGDLEGAIDNFLNSHPLAQAYYGISNPDSPLDFAKAVAGLGSFGAGLTDAEQCSTLLSFSGDGAVNANGTVTGATGGCSAGDTGGAAGSFMDSLNPFSGLFGPGGTSVTVSFDAWMQSQNWQQGTATNLTATNATFTSGGDTNFLDGTNAQVGEDMSVDAGGSVNTSALLLDSDSDSSSLGLSLGVTVGGPAGIIPNSIGINTSSSDSTNTTAQGGSIAVGGNISITAGDDSTISGTTITATTASVDVDGNLTIESVQSTGESSESNLNLNVGMTGGGDQPLGLGNLGVGAGSGDGSSAVTTAIGGIITKEELEINAETLELVGAALFSDSDELDLTYEELLTRNLEDYDLYDYDGFNLSLNPNALRAMLDGGGMAGRTAVPLELGLTDRGKDYTGMTYVTMSDGTVSVVDPDTGEEIANGSAADMIAAIANEVRTSLDAMQDELEGREWDDTFEFGIVDFAKIADDYDKAYDLIESFAPTPEHVKAQGPAAEEMYKLMILSGIDPAAAQKRMSEPQTQEILERRQKYLDLKEAGASEDELLGAQMALAIGLDAIVDESGDVWIAFAGECDTADESKDGPCAPETIASAANFLGANYSRVLQSLLWNKDLKYVLESGVIADYNWRFLSVDEKTITLMLSKVGQQIGLLKECLEYALSQGWDDTPPPPGSPEYEAYQGYKLADEWMSGLETHANVSPIKYDFKDISRVLKNSEELASYGTEPGDLNEQFNETYIKELAKKLAQECPPNAYSLPCSFVKMATQGWVPNCEGTSNFEECISRTLGEATDFHNANPRTDFLGIPGLPWPGGLLPPFDNGAAVLCGLTGLGRVACENAVGERIGVPIPVPVGVTFPTTIESGGSGQGSGNNDDDQEPDEEESEPESGEDDTEQLPQYDGEIEYSSKIENQMAKRGWTDQQVREALMSDGIPATGKNGPATRYVHPTSGQSVVVDNVTREVFHVGGAGYLYD